MITGEKGWHWFVLDINPEPWAIGPLSVGRSKGGKVFPKVGRNEQLYFYQMAVKEELGTPLVFFEGKIELKMFFWRRRDEYKTPQARTHRKHEADGTNMMKATEDALQGVLFKNDRDVNHAEWIIVEQGPEVNPRIVIAIREGQDFPTAMEGFPQDVSELLDSMDEEPDNDYDPNEWRG